MMGVLEAIGGWKQLNQDKLEQIKEDNAPLYDAISKALNLLAKKYGGEDIVIQKPIEVIEEVVPTTGKGVLTDYEVLKKIEILSLTTGGSPNGKQIRNSLIENIILDKNEIREIGIALFEDDLGAKLADLVDRNWLNKIGDEYQLTPFGAEFIDKYEIEKNLAEEQPTTEAPTPQYNLPQDRLEGILKRLSEARAKIHDYVTMEDLSKQLYDVVVPLDYKTYFEVDVPSLEGDLNIMESMGLVKSRITIDPNTQVIDTEFDIDTEGSFLLTQLKLEEAQQQKKAILRPSPTESATLFPTGTIKLGNDGNQWRVTETKSGVKRWTKFGEMPIDEPIQIEGSSIADTFELVEDEVDLDLLEQQLNDDSLEFDLNEDDLDNLEF